jgi:hypothetical protein
MVEVDKRVRRPQPRTQLLPGHHIPRALEQDQENVIRPAPKTDARPLLEDVAPTLVDLKEPEPVRLRSSASSGHGIREFAAILARMTLSAKRRPFSTLPSEDHWLRSALLHPRAGI